ncbi:creatininase [Labrys monachus]|uniref:Creatinine amidohydrolase n=1 Tax=Labrys monachus TaxID=217067 RepID=A0ABU0FBC0_9HYPH|nr:creatininase [Labrys monachus]MDQ0391622.1 creatinine amidohydrolase [Labrys monachus]
MTSFRMADITWPEYQEALAGDPVILIPVGATEQHGPHLPLSVDVILPTAVCEGVAAAGGYLVAPPLAYGYKSMPRSGGGQHFPGTTSLDAASLIAQVRDLTREFVRHGARKIAFIVGHTENLWHVSEGCDLAYRENAPNAEGLRLLNVGYWQFLPAATAQAIFGTTSIDWDMEHAGIMETSMMLHLRPDLVHMDRLVDHAPSRVPGYELWPYDIEAVPADGVLNTASSATADKGQQFLDAYVSSLSVALTEAFGAR